MSDVEIRRVRPDELGAAGDCTVAAYAIDGFGAPHYVPRLRDAATRDREAEVWVAADTLADGAATRPRVVGCVTFCPPGSPWREIATDDSEGEFRMLAVAPAARGRGLGRQLVRLCLDLSLSRGQRRMVLCSDSRMTAAHRLYASFGFVRLHERDWSPVPGLDLLAYTLEL